MSQQTWKPRTKAEWQEEFDYRAAIIQYEGGYTRMQAAAMAHEIVGPVPTETKRTR